MNFLLLMLKATMTSFRTSNIVDWPITNNSPQNRLQLCAILYKAQASCASTIINRMKAHYGGTRLLSHCIFFTISIFELQPCHYYERFSQCFCIKTQRSKMPKKLHFLFHMMWC
jgi:hypothetical protein